MVGWNHGREVQQRARKRGDRDGSLHRQLAGGKIGRVMNDPAPALLRPATAWKRQLDECAGPWPHAQDGSGAAVTGDSARTRSEQHTQHRPFGPELRMSECVDTAVEAGQPARVTAMVDRVGAEPDRQELPAAHNAVLRSGEVMDLALDRVEAVHMTGEVRTGANSPPSWTTWPPP